MKQLVDIDPLNVDVQPYLVYSLYYDVVTVAQKITTSALVHFTQQLQPQKQKDEPTAEQFKSLKFSVKGRLHLFSSFTRYSVILYLTHCDKLPFQLSVYCFLRAANKTSVCIYPCK